MDTALKAEIIAEVVAEIRSSPPPEDGVAADGHLPEWAQKLMLEVEQLKLWRQQQCGGAILEARTGDEKTRSETALHSVPAALTDAATGRAAAEDELPTRDDEAGAGSVKLEDSMWDAVLLLGIQGQGVACTAWSTIILLQNVLIQATLTLIIAWQMIDPLIDETTVSEFRHALRPRAVHSK